MLTAFTLEDFRSYRQATLPLSALTVLIGANASGKSNAIEGLRLLSWLQMYKQMPTNRDFSALDSPLLLQFYFAEKQNCSLNCSLVSTDLFGPPCRKRFQPPN